MFRLFCFRSRSLVATLLVFCLVSASLWAYSAEALADALTDEGSVITLVGDSGDHPPIGMVCNHGCHAQTHLTGFETGTPQLSFSCAAETLCFEPLLFVVPTQPRDGPFRPPRTALQA
jgi:hypothetical protein